MHPCPGNWVAFWRALVYYARADQAFSAGIKCRPCTTVELLFALEKSSIANLLRFSSHNMYIHFKQIKGFQSKNDKDDNLYLNHQRTYLTAVTHYLRL